MSASFAFAMVGPEKSLKPSPELVKLKKKQRSTIHEIFAELEFRPRRGRYEAFAIVAKSWLGLNLGSNALRTKEDILAFKRVVVGFVHK